MARPKTTPDLQLPLGRPLVAFRDATRRFLEREVPASAVRDALATEAGFDPALWARAVALEWPALLVPDACGGAGGSLLECAILAEETGRALLPLPVLSACVLAPLALREAGDEAARAELLPALADGAIRAAYAHDRAASPLVLDAGGRATGTLARVVDGASADVILAAAQAPDGAVALVAIEPAATGVERADAPSIDPTRRVATVRLDGAPVRVLGADAAAGLARADAAIATIVAAEAVGGARRCLEQTTSWATLREQFGSPIGTFQAVKHRLADLLVAVETATAGARLAARLGDAGSGDHAAAAALARGVAARAYRQAAGDAMQLHGGMGYTWDHDAHLHQKRAKATERLFGDAAAARATLADHLGIGG